MSQQEKKALFSDDEGEGETAGFTINQKYAEKHQYQEQRKELEKLQQKYGTNPGQWEEDESDEDSDSSSEDEEARKLTNKAEKKFQDLLYRIRNKDQTLMAQEGEYFTDGDFSEDEDK